jgi:hypothetical protein
MSYAACPKTTSEVSDEFYSLERWASKSLPKTMEGLRNWLSKHNKTKQWDAKLYVARSIEWNEDPPEFRQTGCSPNFQARLWSLACCKYPMRAAAPFRDQAKDGSIPTFVFTLARKHGSFQPLVSIAKLTARLCFETMEEYARFLLKSGKHKLISSRLTRTREKDLSLARRFGDCHADRQGSIGAPSSHHVHAHRDAWKADINGDHLILVSKEFLLWDHPVFATRKTIGQSRYGKNLTPENLTDILTSI